MLKTRQSRDFWLLAIVAILVLGAGLGLRDPWPADEPRFALVAKQMVESGDWLFPHRGSELYSDKPPMLMWLQAAFYSVTGNLRIGFLLPSLLAALGTLWCVVDLGRRLWTRRVGVYAGWALLFALQFTYQAKKAQIDPLVVFWITLSMYGFLRHLLHAGREPGPNWRMWVLGWFAAGLGTITKGVGAVALLVLIPAGFASLRGWPGVRVGVRDAKSWLGPLAFFAATAIWLVPMMTVALGSGQPEYRAYLDDILFRQTAQRYANSWGHQQPAWYFLKVMATMWLPALLALPWALPAWRRRLRRRDPRYLLPLAWWGLVLLFFSLSSGKRDVYILPALPMICLALAPLLPGIVRRAWAKRLAFGFALLLSSAAFVAGALMWFDDHAFETRLLADRGFSDGGHAAAALLLAIGGWGLAALAWHRVRQGVRAMLWMLGGTWVLYGLVAYPLLNPSSSAGAVMAAAAQRIGPQGELGLVAWKEQNLLMSQPTAADFGFLQPWHEQLQRGIAWQAREPARRWLFVQDDALGDCVSRKQASFVGYANWRGWWLVPHSAIVPGCVPQAIVRDDDDDGN